MKKKAKRRKLYAPRLEAQGVPLNPIVPEVKPVRQFQLAHLAATLATGPDAKSTPSELTAKAMQIWNASGRAMVVEAQAEVLVKGLFDLDELDWVSHAKALISSFDDMDGAVPGQNPAEQMKAGYEAARRKAGAAVAEVWKYGPRNATALKSLFTAASETEESRAKGVMALLAFAKQTVEASEKLKWRAEDSNLLKASLLCAWEPLGTWDGVIFDKALKQAKGFIEKPETVLSHSIIAFYPLVARWLAVMRQAQLAANKKRPTV